MPHEQQIIIRNEKPHDYAAVRQLIMAAFENQPYSQKNEHQLVDALRTAKALSLSLVAELDHQVVGHIAFSLVNIDSRECGWYGLAPVSVKPDMQRRGIGRKLITTGLKQLKERNASGCVLLGEPEYYTRFGFKSNETLQLEGVPPEYFMVLSFQENLPAGKVTYHPSFSTL